MMMMMFLFTYEYVFILDISVHDTHGVAGEGRFNNLTMMIIFLIMIMIF